MSYRSHGARGLRDANEPDVLAPIRAATGWVVWLLEHPVDALLRAPDGSLHLVEIKMPKGTLTPGQKRLQRLHPTLQVWRHPGDAERFLLEYGRGK